MIFGRLLDPINAHAGHHNQEQGHHSHHQHAQHDAQLLSLVPVEQDHGGNAVHGTTSQPENKDSR